MKEKGFINRFGFFLRTDYMLRLFAGAYLLTIIFNNDTLLIIIINKDKLMERRNTMQKALTYEAVMAYSGHPSADDVYRIISSEHSSISKATVYRNLSLLSEEGKIGKVESFGNGEIHYDHRTDKHYHGYCRKCGKVVDINLSYDSSLIDKASPMDDDFAISSHELIFEGICKDCRDKEKENGTERI